jgi:hypothetical protein
MAVEQIDVITRGDELRDYVEGINHDDDPRPVVCELGGGVLKFVQYAFPEVETSSLYAQANDREPEGRGAHFDVYGDYVEHNFHWIGIFNLAGKAALRTTVLPPELASSYFSKFPEPDDNAFEARRHYSAIALMGEDAEILEGELKPNSGLILPQRANGPHIVHDIVPTRTDDPGKFIKFVVPSLSETAETRIKNGAYEPWDDFVTRRLAVSAEGAPDMPFTPAASPRPLPRSLPRRRRCNLD